MRVENPGGTFKPMSLNALSLNGALWGSEANGSCRRECGCMGGPDLDPDDSNFLGGKLTRIMTQFARLGFLPPPNQTAGK